MSYNITIGTGASQQTVSIAPGTTNTSSTSLTLVGKNFPGYGQYLMQNFVQLLQNFNGSTAPNNPVTGQVWWDASANSNAGQLKVYRGPYWKGLANTHIGNTKPDDVTSKKGDMWWDTDAGQLKGYSGSEWKIIGPASTADQGQSGAIVETITDNSGLTNGSQNHVVIKFYISQVLIAILHGGATTFTPLIEIPGFSTVKPGFNLNSTLDLTYFGDAENALMLDNTPASSFAKLTGTSPFTSAQTISSNGGLTLGAAGELTLTATTGAARIASTVNNNSLDFFANVSGYPTRIMTISPGTLQTNVTITSNTALGGNTHVATKLYVDDAIKYLGLGGSGGNTTFSANVVPSANVTYDLGSTTGWWNNIYGTAIHARYADVAERFEIDMPQPPGTVVELGGVNEVCAVGEELSENILGVISTQAAYLMNSGAGTDLTHPPIAVSGRVPVRVIGKIKKGDRLVSAGNGLARAGARTELSPWNVIGRALTSKTTDGEGIIEATVKLNS
jgi:hypothetical protein